MKYIFKKQKQNKKNNGENRTSKLSRNPKKKSLKSSFMLLVSISKHCAMLRRQQRAKPSTQQTLRAALVMVGCCQRGLQLHSVMISVTCANKIQRS